MSPASSRTRRLVNLGLLLAGLAAMTWTLHGIGFARLAAMVATVGWWFVVVLVVELATVSCDAAALRCALRPESRMVRVPRLLATQLAGQAMNTLLPTGALGEATKVSLLAGHAPRDRVLGGVLLVNLLGFLTSVGLVVVGLPVVALLLELPPALERAAWLAAGLGLALAAASVALVQRGMAASLADLLRAVREIAAERRQRWDPHLQRFDAALRLVGAGHAPGLLPAWRWLLLSRLLGWLEYGILLYAIAGSLPLELWLASLPLGVVIGWLATLVPMGAGVTEGGHYALFAALGVAPAVGVAVVVTRRLRQLAVATLGLGALALLQAERSSAGPTALRRALARRRMAATS